MVEILATIGAALALLPVMLYVWNVFLFRGAPELRWLTPPARQLATPPARQFTPPARPTALPPARPISVLIPARNEEVGIAACVESVLASQGVKLEVIVLDDGSEDQTRAIVETIARRDERVRVVSAPPLPEGWCGKQHACFILAKLARFPTLTFLDADVRLEPDGLARMARFLEQSKAGLVSGFPRQETGALFERLLIPLINWLLLSYLPIGAMRRSRWPAFGAGCGQWFMTSREAYGRLGGHESIKTSMHDGIALPRAYRRVGMATDLCDATDLATCRMYRGNRAVWDGLAKNAHEGMGSAVGIVPWTVLLLAGGLTIPSRLHSAWRFRQSWFGAALHPVGVLLLIAIQWYALIRRVAGKPVGWKGRGLAAPGSPLARARSFTRPVPRRSPDRLAP